MNRAEALALVIAPMPSGMARKIVRETLLSWPEADVTAWHRLKDAERKRERRAEEAIVRSPENTGTAQRPVSTEVTNGTASCSVSNARPDMTPPSPPPSPRPPSTPAPTPTHVTKPPDDPNLLPDGSRKSRPDSEQQVIARCAVLGLPMTDGQAIWAKWEGNGFTNDRKPMKNWHQVVKSWQLHGYLPSQRNGNKNHGNNPPRPTEPKPALVPGGVW